MDDDTLTGEGSDEGDSLSETIAAALEEDQGENIIAELGRAQDAAQETPETDDEARADDGNGAETPGDGGADLRVENERLTAKITELETKTAEQRAKIKRQAKKIGAFKSRKAA